MILIGYQEVSKEEFRSNNNLIEENNTYKYYLLKCTIDKKEYVINTLITSIEIKDDKLFQNWLNENDFNFWELTRALYYYEVNHSFYIKSINYRKDDFLDPVLSASKGDLLWQNQLELILSVYFNKKKEVVKFRKDLNAKKAEAFKKAENIFLPNNMSLSEVFTERMPVITSFGNPNLYGAKIIFENKYNLF